MGVSFRFTLVVDKTHTQLTSPGRSIRVSQTILSQQAQCLGNELLFWARILPLHLWRGKTVHKHIHTVSFINDLWHLLFIFLHTAKITCGQSERKWKRSECWRKKNAKRSIKDLENSLSKLAKHLKWKCGLRVSLLGLHVSFLKR